MADHHRHHHRPNHITLPPRATIPSATSSTPRPSYPMFPYLPSTPASTPSKHRFSLSKPSNTTTTTSSFSFLLLLLFSLRSLYSLLPFLRSSPPSFSIFPFSFLVSLLSFILTLSFALFASLFGKDSLNRKSQQSILSLTKITQSQHKFLLAKSLLLAIVFLLKFQALRYCGTAAMILAELSGNVAARFMTEGKILSFIDRNSIRSSKLRGFIALFSGLLCLSVSWDRIECFPLSHVNITTKGFFYFPSGSCLRIWPMLLPFLSGYLGCYERVSSNWGAIRELGQKRVRLITLFFTTLVLFMPAVVSMFVFEAEGDSISLSSLGWPLANTVVFSVLLSENYTEDKIAVSKDIQREYFVTFVCTVVLELFYFPELSLWGLLISGMLLLISVRELNPIYHNYYPELGFESPESFSGEVMKPIRHILSERKSRKIALFLLINTAYMVVEFFAGFMSNSLGLISDACHMLFDCAALAIGLYASYISRLPANSQFNYGRGRFEVLSGYANAVFLVLVGALITLESFERILDPQEISTSSLLTVSIGGLVVNLVGLVFFHEEHHHAHGGSGACSHTHHSHSHAQSHHHDHHSHEHSEEHKKLINIVHNSSEKLGLSDLDHEHDHIHRRHHHNHHHDHNHHNHHHDHDHDHHNHHHDHDHHNHHHHHDHDHDHHDHHHDHDHHNHHHNHDHHNHDQDHHNHHHNHDHHNHDQDHHNHHHDHDHDHDHSHDQYHDHQHRRHNHDGQCDHNHHLTQPLLEENKRKHHHHRHIDHNMQGIFLHVLADTMGSVGVVISTLLIKYKGWLVADPACSIFISALIVSSVIPLLRNSAEILLQRVPRSCEQDLKEALKEMMKLKGVVGTQNLHVWSLTNTDIVGTVHLHVSADTDKTSVKKRVSHILHDAGVKDLTVQAECINSR